MTPPRPKTGAAAEAVGEPGWTIRAATRADGPVLSEVVVAAGALPEAGVSQAWLVTEERNERARRLYEREGWRRDGSATGTACGSSSPAT